MKDRKNILAIYRWQHTDTGFRMSWPVLHLLSDKARAVVAGAVAIGSFCVGLTSYLKEVSLIEAATMLSSVSMPSVVVYGSLIVFILSSAVFALNFVLRKELGISKKKVILRHPWRKMQTWPRSSLAAAEMETHSSDDGEGSVTSYSRVQVLFRSRSISDDISIGSSMGPSVAQRLVKELRNYTPIR